jgi:hypothetical protein
MTYLEQHWDPGYGDVARTKNLLLLRDFVQSLVSIGPSSERPIDPPVGFQFYDTDLLQPIWWNGTEWTDALGNSLETTYVTE